MISKNMQEVFLQSFPTAARLRPSTDNLPLKIGAPWNLGDSYWKVTFFLGAFAVSFREVYFALVPFLRQVIYDVQKSHDQLYRAETFF